MKLNNKSKKNKTSKTKSEANAIVDKNNKVNELETYAVVNKKMGTYSTID